jgi:hypothetical protein
MKKNRLILAALLTMILALQVTGRFPAFADRHPESEVKKFLLDVESELDDAMKKPGAGNYAARELQRAAQYLNAAKRYLSENERDLAFYELKKASAHFRLIDERRKMIHAEIELELAEKQKDK